MGKKVKAMADMSFLKLPSISGRQQRALLAYVHVKGPQRPWCELPLHIVFLELKFSCYVTIKVLSVPPACLYHTEPYLISSIWPCVLLP